MEAHFKVAGVSANAGSQAASGEAAESGAANGARNGAANGAANGVRNGAANGARNRVMNGAVTNARNHAEDHAAGSASSDTASGAANSSEPEKAAGKRAAIPLDALRAEVQECHKCPLSEGRTQTVFGTGNPSARVLIVGEAPGKNEDLRGEPFVGAAGKYLDELLGYAGLVREDIFIANVLKCRPPGNRNPRPEEIELCTPYLREQTRAINPEVIVTLGNFATKFILKTEVGITHLRGSVQRAGRFMVFPVFHPAAAIYDRSKREVLENDFRALGTLLGNVGSNTEARHASSTGANTEPRHESFAGAIFASASPTDDNITSAMPANSAELSDAATPAGAKLSVATDSTPEEGR